LAEWRDGLEAMNTALDLDYDRPELLAEQGLGRRANVLRAVVPDNGEAVVGTIGVVHMQRASIAQLEISLCHHWPSPVAERPTLTGTVAALAQLSS